MIIISRKKVALLSINKTNTKNIHYILDAKHQLL